MYFPATKVPCFKDRKKRESFQNLNSDCEKRNRESLNHKSWEIVQHDNIILQNLVKTNSHHWNPQHHVTARHALLPQCPKPRSSTFSASFHLAFGVDSSPQIIKHPRVIRDTMAQFFRLWQRATWKPRIPLAITSLRTQKLFQ